jgi:DNA-directed RNA polymerase specialized sigma24 family protein
VDRELVERARHGDRDAYEALARASANRLYATAYRIVHDRDLADDALQQTLVQMWRELPSLRDPDRFDAWTYRLAVIVIFVNDPDFIVEPTVDRLLTTATQG